MFEQRQEQRLRLLLVTPVAVLLAIAGFTVLTARDPGQPVREAAFDLVTRLVPRPVAADEPKVATIVIDEATTARLGPWPWPRSAFAGLINAAEDAGAASVTLAVPVGGEDPFSPDIIARRWMTDDGLGGDRLAAMSVLPSNDLILARAVAGGPIALGVAPNLRPSSEGVRWQRANLDETPWLSLTGGSEAGLGFLALPAVLGNDPLTPELRETRVAAVTGFPVDPDGTVRRFAPLYAANESAVPVAGLAGLAAGGLEASIVLSRNAASTAGRLPASLLIADAALTLDHRAELRLWFPRVATAPSVPAWRVLDDPETWTAALAGHHVFIGETVSPEGRVATARGTMPRALLHALTARQLGAGLAPTRPAWAGFAEAGGAIALGLLAVFAVIFLPTMVAVAAAVVIALLSVAGSVLLFRSTGMLLDPSPAAMAALGGPMAVGATVLANMAVRDDAVRGAFHGALPQKAMRQLQGHGGGRLLRGVHREVTVLSCAFRLPPTLIRQFEDRPDDYVLFKASANDRLRRTILDHQGTVDYGEDGRLLGYWNVPIEEPKHIELACSCALRMLDDVSVLSHQVAESRHGAMSDALDELTDGRIEIGIATGPCFAGPVGLGGRNRYAALGQPVSFAGRLRARSELYGPAILTDAAVYEALRHHYAFLDLDFVRRDQDSTPETIYGLVGNPFLKASKTFRQLADVQRELLEAWRSRDLTAATRHLQQLRGLPGVPQPYVELFEQRIMNARMHKARRQNDHADILGL